MPAFAQLTEPLDCLAEELVAKIANYLVKEPSLDAVKWAPPTPGLAPSRNPTRHTPSPNTCMGGEYTATGGVEKQRTSPHLNTHQAVYGR
jgi:hypothetical protein